MIIFNTNLNIVFYMGFLSMVLFLIYIGVIGFLVHNLKMNLKMFSRNTITVKIVNLIIYFIIFCLVLSFVLDVGQLLKTFISSNISFELMLEGSANDKIPMDPVRWWPSGVPQSLATIGASVAVFRMLGKSVSPQVRLLSALTAAGVTVGNITYHSAIENSVGFNRFMFSMIQYQQTGNWPSIDEISKSKSDEQISSILTEAVDKAGAANSISSSSQTVTSSVNNDVINNFIGDDNPMVNIIIETINSIPEFGKNILFKLFEPSIVTGFLDDLLGQQLVIYFSLFLILISLSILILVFMWNLFLFSFRDVILNYITNKYLIWFIKYQIILLKTSLIVLPIIIFFSLFILGHGLYFLITHPIPYHTLPIDLHTYVEFIPKK